MLLKSSLRNGMKNQKTFRKKIVKNARMNPQAPDFGIQRNYLELFLELPWNEYSKDNFDLKRAQKILDRDHFG
jgi:ATP-dependent Lon protease